MAQVTATKSRLTLIIDGNWLLMSRLFAIGKKYRTDNELALNLQLMLLKSINVVLRQFPMIDNIIFVADGGSWRNQLPVPKVLGDTAYKGPRQLSPDYNWEVIFGAYEELIALFNEHGITAVREPGIEGDDWCWYWTTKLNAEGTNCIIWSKDRDLTQLVKNNPDNSFTIWWNKDNGIVKEYSQEDENDWIFESFGNQNKNMLVTIERKTLNVSMIYPQDVVIDKVFRGDAGDNILPPIKRVTETKTYRITSKELDLDMDIHNEKDVKEYVNKIITSKKYSGKIKESFADILEHIKYNIKLVELSEHSYPTEILNIMKKYTTYNVNKKIDVIQNILNAKQNNVFGLFEDM